MTDPAKPKSDAEKFAPQNVTEADDTKDHRKDPNRADLPRGSETATRNSARNRG